MLRGGFVILAKRKVKKPTKIQENLNLIVPQNFKLQVTLESESTFNNIAWSPDGQMLASGSDDNTVQLWDAKTGKHIKTLKVPFDELHVQNDELHIHDMDFEVLDVVWSPDGQILASGHNDTKIRLWDVKTGKLIKTLEGHTDVVFSVAWSPNGHMLASGADDSTFRLWDVKTGELIQTFVGNFTTVHNVAWSPDGQTLASGSSDNTVRLWNMKSGKHIKTLEGHTNSVFSVSWSPDGQMLASGSSDNTVRLWNALTGQQIGILEGHTEAINKTSFSPDGSILASRSWDQTYRFWRCDTWETVAELGGLKGQPYPSVLAFHPTDSFVATLGIKNNVVRIWKINIKYLLRAKPTEAIHYTTAKIALVGDSGVGKTGLGWRLSHGEFKEHSSTHGQQFWLIDELLAKRIDETDCEAVLWDFAGQPDYRLIHALFLDDVDLALILFNPANRQDPLKDVEYWIKQMSHCKEGPRHTILVGARIDRGTPTLTQQELDDFCAHHDITGGYVGTSALTGEGLDNLIECIKAEINWDEMTTTITTATFKRIKEYVLALKENTDKANILMNPIDLRAQLETRFEDWNFSDNELMAAVGHLANHGYVAILRGSSGNKIILLAPEILTNLASSFILEARRNPKGLGALDEAKVLKGEYNLPEIAGLKEQEKETLLDAATILFLEHNICFRERLGAKTYLVFPSLINQKKPHLEDVEIIEDISYTLNGAVENIYASLVVLLGYTNTFTRTNQWQNSAQYEMDKGEICGFRQISEREGEIDLILYYGRDGPKHTRLLFQGLFEKFLSHQEVTVTRYSPIECISCKYLQERNQVVRRIKDGKSFIFCSECGEKISLPRVTTEIALTPHDQKKLDQQQNLANMRTAFEAALTYIKGFIRDRDEINIPNCFISYAWGEIKHENWVARLAKDLENAGIDVILDKKDNMAIGENVSRFISLIENSEFIAVVGTSLYRKKYENKVSETGSVVAAEVDLINLRLVDREEKKKTVLPLLLEGDEENSFPPLIRGKVYADFKSDDKYFASLFDLILTLHGIQFDDSAIIDLRESMQSELRGRT